MKIEHLAIWVSDLELIRDFYVKYFQAVPNSLYHNTKTGFKSYFLSFNQPPRLEIMTRPDMILASGRVSGIGLAHFAFSVGSTEHVVALTELLRSNGFNVVGEPRITGDGYFESVVEDPDGNRVEITV